MTIKSFPLGLMSSLILGVSAFPVAVQAQFAPVQNAEQSVTIRGNNNTVNQEINQTVIVQPRVSGPGGFRGRPFSRFKDRREKFKKDKYDDYEKKYNKYEKKYDKKYDKYEKKYGKKYLKKGYGKSRGWGGFRDDDD